MPASAPVPTVRQSVVASSTVFVRELPVAQLPEPSHTWPVRQEFMPQTVPGGWNWLLGQVADEPVQFSAMSHTPADGRQTVEAGRKPSAGQLADEPVQF